MRWQINHDWQGSLATPRPLLGHNTKIHLFLLLCAVWVFLGLIGHAPWKPLESTAAAIIKNLLLGQDAWIAPLAGGELNIPEPPLYYWLASLFSKLLAGILAIHDAARLSNSVWMALLLLMVGMTGREMWSRGAGRHAVFLLIGSVGLMLNAHSLNPSIANLSALAMGIYGLALSRRRPWCATLLLGLAIALAFLNGGLNSALILVLTALCLPVCFANWRTPRLAMVLISAGVIASVPILLWAMLLSQHDPKLLVRFFTTHLHHLHQQIETGRTHFAYFATILLWYAWPALPLGLWGWWQHRHRVEYHYQLQISTVFALVSWGVLGTVAADKDIYALPLLLPFAIVGASAINTLKRGAATALYGFGCALFGLVVIVSWLSSYAMYSTHPAKIYARLQFLSGLNHSDVSWLVLLMAGGLTVAWLWLSLRSHLSNSRIITHWAMGMTVTWGLWMTLWLPLFDNAKSYGPIWQDLEHVLAGKSSCVHTNVHQPQRMLLRYYTHLKLVPVTVGVPLSCDFYLVRDSKNEPQLMPPVGEWRLVWQRARPADRKESFRLLERDYFAKPLQK